MSASGSLRADPSRRAAGTAVGAWLALGVVGVIAAYAGRIVVRRVPVRIVHRTAGVLFALFAALAAVAPAG